MNYKDGNIEDRWNVFKQQFEIYLLASGKPEKYEPVKIAMLLNILGEKGLKILMKCPQNQRQSKIC